MSFVLLCYIGYYLVYVISTVYNTAILPTTLRSDEAGHPIRLISVENVMRS